MVAVTIAPQAQYSRLIAVNPTRLADVLPLVQGELEAICQRSKDRYSMDGLIHQFATRQWILWLVASGDQIKAVLATELYHDVSGMKCCMVRFCTGADSKSWVHLIAEIEAYARAEGCAKIDMVARKGWAQRLPEYQLTHVCLEKDLQ